MRAIALVSILFFALALGSVQNAFADPPTPEHTPPGKLVTPGPRGTPAEGKAEKGHGLFGTVTKKSAASFNITTKQGDETVIVSSNTKFHIPTKKNATYADLGVGDQVAVNGTPTASGLEAKQVAVAPGKPTTQHRVGTVSNYNAGSSITIQDAQGKSETFALTSQTEIQNPKGSGVTVGDKVTIVSRRDPSTDVFTASAIVVHPQ